MSTVAYGWDRLLRTVRDAAAADYEVVRMVGAGGMACVYFARRRAGGGDVALKVMHPGLLTRPTEAERFEREAHALMLLEHVNIVRVHAVRRYPGLHCMEMDWIPGGTLAARIAAAPRGVPLSAALRWIAQVGGALAHAHGCGVVHRDVNASNVLFDARDAAVVTDFGIAAIADLVRLTEVGCSVGTPAYMSPEQLSDLPATAASDQYALGVVAYELLTGRRPFYGSARDLVQAQLTAAPPPLQPLRPDCPAHVAAAVLRMLAKDPARRFPGVPAALEALASARTA